MGWAYDKGGIVIVGVWYAAHSKDDDMWQITD